MLQGTSVGDVQEGALSDTSSSSTVSNTFNIKNVRIVALISFDPEIQPFRLALGIAISFETLKQRDAFVKNIQSIVTAEYSTCPISDVQYSLRAPVVQLHLARGTSPAVAFLKEHYPGFDFESRLAIKQVAKSASRSLPAPITPAAALDATRKRSVAESTSSNASEAAPAAKRQDVKCSWRI